MAAKIRMVGAELRAQRRAEGKAASDDNAVRSGEEYEKAKAAAAEAGGPKGSAFSWDEKRVTDFAKRILQSTGEELMAKDGKLTEPVVHFLIGARDRGPRAPEKGKGVGGG